jgi:SagB-type dehydrogenase family enzyme
MLTSVAATEIAVEIDDEIITDFVFNGELVIDGPRRRETRLITEAPELADSARLMLPLGARSIANDRATMSILLPLGEPNIEQHSHALCLERRRREVTVVGDARPAWHLLRLLDGEREFRAVLAALAPDEREGAARLAALLVAAGGVDASGRAVAAWLHSATKKGVFPAGDLTEQSVLRQLTDGDYRIYSGRPMQRLNRDVPSPLSELFALTRRRRSSNHYDGRSIRRVELEAILDTACGVTGELRWAERRVALRAYPSSGGLYAVEVYPVVFAVDALLQGVYHYRSLDGTLIELNAAEHARFVAAAVPEQRAMMRGAAAMICLTGRFFRHERKYGQGGYRMLAAEAGHISQNLILAATALGLAARPCGGVFDELLNRLLGVGGDEQFLLSVLVGHASDEEVV